MRTKWRISTQIPLWYWLLSPTQLAASYIALCARLLRSPVGSEARASRWSTQTPFIDSLYASLVCNPTTSLCPLTASSSLSLPCTLLSKAEDYRDLDWGGARRAVGLAGLWGRQIRFCRIAYSSVLPLWLGFKVGFKLALGVGLLLQLVFKVGLKLELGVGLKLEDSFIFLDWWCLVFWDCWSSCKNWFTILSC